MAAAGVRRRRVTASHARQLVLAFGQRAPALLSRPAGAAVYSIRAVPSFPDTRLTIIEGLSSDDTATRSRALDLVARAYRAPIVAVLRRRWSLATEDAEDLAHDFFAQALAKEWLQRYDPGRGRFRAFLRSCLMAYASTAHEAAGREKRGGRAVHLSLDDATAAPSSDPAVEALFEREWARSVLTLSLDALRQECEREGRNTTYAVFHAREVEGAEAESPPSYDALAVRFGVPATQVTNYLNWARRRFRAHVLETVRALTASEGEYREEVRALLGVEVA